MLRLRKLTTELRIAGVWSDIWTLGYRKQRSSSSHSSQTVNEPAMKRLRYHRTRSSSTVFTTSTAELYCDSNGSSPPPQTIFILLTATLTYSLHSDISTNINFNFETITNLMHKYLYSYNIKILYMFRALLCPSSGGSIVYVQHRVPSLSVSGRTVAHR